MTANPTAPEAFYEALGRRLKAAILRTGKSYSEISREYGNHFADRLMPSAVSRILSGDQRMYLHQAFALSRIVGEPLDTLIDGESPQQPPQALSPAITAIVAALGETESIRRLSQAPASKHD